MRVNGTETQGHFQPMKRLLDVLREDLHLTGTKEGCGEGECGACAVLIDGQLQLACLCPVGQCNDVEIETIESASKDALGIILTQAFWGSGSAQCGICTPGVFMSAKALLSQNPNPSLEEVKFGMSSNLCRCTGYTKIIEGVLLAAQKLRESQT